MQLLIRDQHRPSLVVACAYSYIDHCHSTSDRLVSYGNGSDKNLKHQWHCAPHARMASLGKPFWLRLRHSQSPIALKIPIRLQIQLIVPSLSDWLCPKSDISHHPSTISLPQIEV